MNVIKEKFLTHVKALQASILTCLPVVPGGSTKKLYQSGKEEP